MPLEQIKKPSQLKLIVLLGTIRNEWTVWVYPKVTPKCPDHVYETEVLDETARKMLHQGKTVYLTPPATKEALPGSVKAQFSTDFWSVGTFVKQPGTMGQLIDAAHPLFKDFPTNAHTNWQWWPMATQRAMVLPRRYETIITEMDSYAYLRPMAQLLEGRCGNGNILISSMGLQNLQQYPEARALLQSIYRYLETEACTPLQEITIEELQTFCSVC